MENCHADLLSTIKNKSVVLPEFARLVALKYIKDVLSFASTRLQYLQAIFTAMFSDCEMIFFRFL